MTERKKRHTEPPPNYWVVPGSGEPFITAPLRSDAPPTALVVQQIARNLAGALAGHNKAEIERQLHIHRATLKRIIDGAGYPDVHTIVALTEYFDVQLWPDRS